MQWKSVQVSFESRFNCWKRRTQSTLRHFQPTTELGLSLHSPVSTETRDQLLSYAWGRSQSALFLNQGLLIPALERVRLVSLTDVHLNHCHCLLDQKVQWEDPRECDWCNCSLTIIVKAGRRILCCQHQKSKGGRELSVWSQHYKSNAHLDRGEFSLCRQAVLLVDRLCTKVRVNILVSWVNQEKKAAALNNHTNMLWHLHIIWHVRFVLCKLRY